MKHYTDRSKYKFGLLMPVSNSNEYNIYYGMKQRCYNKKHKYYKYYGGRGILLSDSWLNSFEQFYKDMGSRPSKDHSIDRIDNNKSYSKENCRWATKSEQQTNRRLTFSAKEQIKQAKRSSLNSFYKKYGNPLTRTNKICSRCKDLKSLNDFYRNKTTKDKHTTYCKQCAQIMKRLIK